MDDDEPQVTGVVEAWVVDEFADWWVRSDMVKTFMAQGYTLEQANAWVGGRLRVLARAWGLPVSAAEPYTGPGVSTEQALELRRLWLCGEEWFRE